MLAGTQTHRPALIRDKSDCSARVENAGRAKITTFYRQSARRIGLIHVTNPTHI